jgi:hypothetical protein
MGLLKHLLFWPVTGPSFLTRFALDKVGDTVRGELTDDQIVKEEILALQMKLELGDIDDEEYVEQEALLMLRLRDVRFWREEFGMGTSGGLVRVSGSATPTPNVAEEVVATPPDPAKPAEGEVKPGGVASPDGASVEVEWGWE